MNQLFKNGLIFEVMGLLITALLFILIRIIFVPKIRYGFRNFFIGDSGRYSIARLQAVGWTYFIIAFQISVITCLLWNNQLNIFKLEFSENILWLLGLSLTSYVAVKGITNEKINNNKIEYKPTPNRADFINSDNGLDFSKFQMLIWTTIALGLYIYDCTLFIEILYNSSGQQASDLFNPDNEEWGVKYIPDIDSSFIVLMGLSQGAYIGKKLIPSHKQDETKNKLIAKLELQKEDLEKKINNYEEALNTFSNSNDPASLQQLQKNLSEAKLELANIKLELERLNKSDNA